MTNISFVQIIVVILLLFFLFGDFSKIKINFLKLKEEFLIFKKK